MSSQRNWCSRNITIVIVMIWIYLAGGPADSLQSNEGGLGPISLGMTLGDTQKVLGATGFPGFRDGLADITGRSFISFSNRCYAGLVFDRADDHLVYLEISSRQQDVSVRQRAAMTASFRDWESDLNFEDWSTSQGFKLGDSQDEILRACKISPLKPLGSIQRLLVFNQNVELVNFAGFAQKDDTWQKLSIENDTGETCLVVASDRACAHTLSVEFDKGKAVSIRLSKK